jgi:hypothetical protein
MSTVNSSTIDLAKNPSAVVGSAQSQWFRRPADHKFESLEKLKAAVDDRRRRAYVEDVDANSFRLMAGTGNDKEGFRVVSTVPVKRGPDRKIETVPTHYAFGQMCSLIGAPAGYFRDKLADRPDIVTAAVNYGMEKRDSEGVKLMAVSPRSGNSLDRLYAVTSQTYGRIWDADVVAAAEKIIAGTNGRFYAPLDWSRKTRALFASDRDVFMFFIDGGSIVDGGGERDQLNRGWFIWNSEVGSKTFGIACFLFRQVCGNFGIWGAQDVRVLKVRHTSGGPERFISEAIPALNDYVRMTAKPIEQAVKKAKALELPSADDEFQSWFMSGKNGAKFNAAEVRRAKEFADAEEGQHHTLWDMYNGFTAAARQMAFAEAKVDMEKRAGQLLERLVA